MTAATISLLLDAILKSSIILLLTLGTAQLLRRQSAAVRHLIWTAGLIGALAVPLFGLVLPGWQPGVARIALRSMDRIREAQTPVHRIVAPTSAAAPQLSVDLQTALPSHSARVVTPSRIALSIWLFGAIAAFTLLLADVAKLARMASRSATVHHSSWRDLVRDVSRALRLKRAVRLVRNPGASVLGTWGWLQPRVMLPPESDSWTNERMRIVLGHELAHIKRNDWLVQIIAETARAVYWFNPLFWMTCERLRRESEHACDDTAIRLGVDGATYASHVLDVARTLKHSGQPGAGALAMASTSNLERRLIAMLNPALNRRGASGSCAAVVILMTLGLTIPIAAMHSQIVPAASAVMPSKSASVQIPVTAAKPATVIPAVVQQRGAAPAAPQSAPPAIAGPTPIPNDYPGAIAGWVYDPTGAFIPGVSVFLTSESGTTMRALSNDSGKFSFQPVPPGNYAMSSTLNGFQTSAVGTLPVKPEQTVNVEVDLRVAEAFRISVNVEPYLPGGTCVSLLTNTKFNGNPFTRADCTDTTPILLDQTAAPAGTPPADGITILSAPPLSAQPPVPGRKHDPIRVGGEVQPGVLRFHPAPVYPQPAIDRGIQGTVEVLAAIGADGLVQSVKEISGNLLLQSSAIDAVKRWEFKPMLLNREPLTTTTTIELNYSLATK